MKEKVFKKGINKRLFSVVIALAMVVTLMPMNSMTVKAGTTRCSCGHRYEEHRGGGCDTCAEEEGTCSGFNGSHIHELTGWVTDENNHWKDCQANDMLCRETIEQSGERYPLYQDRHNWSDGVCTVCEYTCLHPGMTEADATCDKCGKANSGYTPAPATVSSISIKTPPTKTAYTVGETLDLTGAEITATKSDLSTQDIAVTSGMVSGFDSSSAGSKTVTVTYEGKTTTFSVTVTAPSTPPTPPAPSTPSAPAPSTPSTPTPAPAPAAKQYEEVLPAFGGVKDITNTGDATAEANPYAANIVNSTELETLVNVTPEEKKQGVNVWLEIVDASATMPEADKAAIKSVAGKNKIGMYLDATLFKKVGFGQATKVSDVNGKIKISVVIPENLRKSGRTFEIIRVHDGVPTVIQGTYDANTHTFTFETDQFSSYAIAYNDGNKTETTTPKTGDSDAVGMWLVLLVATFSGMATLGYFNRKRRTF